MKAPSYFMKCTLFLLFGVLVFASCSSDDDAGIEGIEAPEHIQASQFTSDAEGWTITGDAQGGYTEASYSPDGGVVDGYIYADDDVQGGVWYFTAPASYHGNKTEYYGATLKFSLFQESSMNNQFESNDIIFKNGNDQIVYQHTPENYPGEEWTHYSIKINSSSGWLKGSYKDGVTATEAEIKAVLANVTEFSIRGEFESGPDTGGMDNITITLD